MLGGMITMQQNLPVFVSSTFSDLQPYRAAVREALHRLEAVVRGMEYFGATPETPKEECLRIVRSCRAYVGIFSMRYGSIDSATGKSFTHLEYEEAQLCKLPSLIYLIDEERQPVLPRNIDFGEPGEKLITLKSTLQKRHVVSFFTTPEDLAVRVSQDLPALARRLGSDVRPGELSKLIETLPRVNWLTDERFEFLKKEIGPIANPIGSDALLREALEFLLAGDRQAPFFLLSRRTTLGSDGAIDLLMEIEKKVIAVIQRGSKILAERLEKDADTDGQSEQDAAQPSAARDAPQASRP
jgi:hypothetical protein